MQQEIQTKDIKNLSAEELKKTKALLTVKEVTELLRISRFTLNTMRESGKIKTISVGTRSIRFKRSEIEKFL